MGKHRYDGKIVVITGASSGFGKGAAWEFARRGACVVLAARRAPLLDELVREIEYEGGCAVAVPADVSQAEDVARIADRALESFEQIDVWINNAGVGTLGRFEDVPLVDHRQVIETNLLGTIYGSYVAMTHFRNRHMGTLINVASVLAKLPVPYYASYTASKCGIAGLSATLRQELRANGENDIHVCTVLPMAMDTPFFDHLSNYTGHVPEPVPPLYDPQQVIDTLLQLAADPQDEVIVGAAGKMAAAAHSLIPGWMEGLFTRQTHKLQMEQAPSAASSTGNVHVPTSVGAEVYGGRLKQKRELHETDAA